MLIPDVAFLSSLGGISATVALLVEGMYTGLLSLDLMGAPINSYWMTYFIITLPSLLTVFAGYLLGVKNITFTKIFLSQAPGSNDKGKQK